MREAVIVDAVRSPVGKYRGTLSRVQSIDLYGTVLEELLRRSEVDPSMVDDHYGGCALQADELLGNAARKAWLAAGLPESVPSLTLNRVCASSQQAVFFATTGVQAGAVEMIVASGIEHMTRVPMDVSGVDDFYGERLRTRYGERLIMMGIAGELIAHRWGISREQQDDLAYRSHARAAEAHAKGLLADQLVAVPATSEDGALTTLDRDEGVRLQPDREKMATLLPAFREDRYDEVFPGQIDWTVTAANSSQLSDAAAAMLICSRECAEALGLRPRARIVANAVIGSDPVLMLAGPIPATRKVLREAGMQLSDMDVVEINEAFASVVLAWQRELGVDDDWFDAHVNPNGGAIAIGHPLGASGLRIMVDLLFELERMGGRFGLQAMCEYGGMGNATVIERLD